MTAKNLTPRGYRPKQAAEVIGVGLTTVYALLKSGDLDSVKVGRSRIILAESIDRLLAADEAA